MPDEATSMQDLESLRDAVAAVRTRIEDGARVSGRDPSAVTVVVTTKYLDGATTAALVAAGVPDVAENRLDSLVSKQDAGMVSAQAHWHFIGRLQSRQAPAIAERVGMIHSLCTASAAARLATADARPELLVQVNVDGDPSKDGLELDHLERFLDALPEQISVAGLMAMPAFADDPEASRAAFASLRALRDRLQPLVTGRHPLAHLSMGTSQDFAVAVEEGATHVRLGRILYAQGEVRG